MSLSSYNQTLTVAGIIVSPDPSKPSFSIEARSGDTFEAVVGETNRIRRCRTLNGSDPLACPDPHAFPARKREDSNLHSSCVRCPAFVIGIYQENEGKQRYEARTVYLLHSDEKRYLFEETHWWPTQTTQMADRILDHLFDARRRYTIDDFSKFYRTTLNILGQPTNETIQELRSSVTAYL